MSELVNVIVKAKNCKESDIKKALKEANIEVISVATVFKEKIEDSSNENQ
jgi:hypothetical protein